MNMQIQNIFRIPNRLINPFDPAFVLFAQLHVFFVKMRHLFKIVQKKQIVASIDIPYVFLGILFIFYQIFFFKKAFKSGFQKTDGLIKRKRPDPVKRQRTTSLFNAFQSLRRSTVTSHRNNNVKFHFSSLKNRTAFA